MHRFYFPDLNFETEKMEIRDKDEIHHLKNVLRLKSGDEIVVFNGQGIEAAGEIVSVMERSVSVVISKVKELIKEGPLITLVCAIPKKAKIEFIIEKATELGVDRIIPLITKRTETKLSRLVLNQKQKRWQTIAINAAKQSKRATVPQIVPAVSLLEAFQLTSYAVKIIGSLREEKKSLLDVLQSNKTAKEYAFFVGPEGDFTPEEYAQAQRAGCIEVSLGNNVLKVDTAALTFMAIANALM